MNAELATSRPRGDDPEKVGRYKLLCMLGTGATAKVFLARVEGLGGFNRLFAVKMIHEHLSTETKFIDLFLNEARIASRIHHPNVVAISDVGIDAGRYYLSMDYVVGETLTRVLQNTWNLGRSLPIEVTLQIVLQCCEGLHAAHELKDREGRPLGVVHRDVAPQNIMVGYDGVVRLMDFGIAKAVDQLKTTRPGVWRGTLPYMAPEQIRADGPLDRRVDVFALGIVLWESTVGQRLFKAKRDLDTLSRVLELEVPRPSKQVPGYPSGLEAIVMKALERDPERRYPNARALGEALRDFLVSKKSRVATAPIEKLMKSVFADAFAKRGEVERLALHGANRETLSALLAETVSPPPPSANVPTEDLPPEVEADTLELPELDRPDQSPTQLSQALRRPTTLTPRAESITHNLEIQTIVAQNAEARPRRRWPLVVGLLLAAGIGVAVFAHRPPTESQAPAWQPELRTQPVLLDPATPEVPATPKEEPTPATAVAPPPAVDVEPTAAAEPIPPVPTPPETKPTPRRDPPKVSRSTPTRTNPRRRPSRPPAVTSPKPAAPEKPKVESRTKPLLFEGDDL